MNPPCDQRILVIDDDAALHDYIRAVLRNRASRAMLPADCDDAEAETCWEVDSAFRGEQGLQMVRAAAEQDRAYFMAFVDIRMPGWDGIETIQRIWREYPDLQVVICTAHSTVSWSEVVERLGQSDRLFILPKPFDITQVRQLITVISERCRTERELQRHREHLEQLAEERAEKLQGTQERLNLNEARLEALLEFGQMADAPLRQIGDFALKSAVAMTNSRIGYLALIGDDESILAMSSWSEDEAIRRGVADALPTEMPELLEQAVRQQEPVVVNRRDDSGPHKRGFPQSDEPVIRYMNVPVFDGGKIVAIAGVGNKADDYDDSDVRQLTLLMQEMGRIIQRNQATEEVRRSRQTLRTILDRLPVGVSVIGTDKTIRQINAAGLEILGYEHEEDILGKKCYETLCPAGEDRCPVVDMHQSVDASPRTIICKDGRRVPIMKTAIPTTLDEEEVLLEAFVDVSDLEQTRTELAKHRDHLEDLVEERTAELAAANRALAEETTKARAATQAKSEFLANMSHELRTPLHGILSYATFGLKKVATASAEDMTKYFKQIESSGKGLLALVSDLLDLSKLEAGSTALAMRRTNLHALALTIVEEFVTTAADRDIRILCEQPQFDTSVIAAHNELGQVLRNLLSNAVKYSPDGSQVDVRFAREGDSITVSVHDQGVGIPSDELDTVFDKFIQSSKTRTGAGGTGLGLAICREIIVAHNGRIWAENCPQGGTIITFEVPISGAAVSTEEESPQAAAL